MTENAVNIVEEESCTLIIILTFRLEFGFGPTGLGDAGYRLQEHIYVYNFMDVDMALPFRIKLNLYPLFQDLPCPSVFAQEALTLARYSRMRSDMFAKPKSCSSINSWTV